MKKALIISNEHSYTYNFRKEIIQGLIDNGFEVHIIVPYGEYVEKLKNMGCRHIDLPLDRRGANPITDMKLLFSYRQTVKKLRPDVVLTYTIKPNVYGGMVCRFLKIPFIPNITGLGTAVANKGILQKLTLAMYKIGLRGSGTVFFQNADNMKFMQKNNIGKSNGRLIPGSGINTALHQFEEYPGENENIKFIFVGRLMRDKGVNELFTACEIIKEKYPEIEFHFIGKKEEDYNEKIDGLISREIIQYHGYQKDVHKFIKTSHAIINPSYHEGMSNVLLEAAASGRPILASNIPGCKETFDESVSGFSFEPRDVDSLVQSVIRFIELPYEKKKEMGKAGRKKIENEFDRKIVVEAYLEEINKLLGD